MSEAVKAGILSAAMQVANLQRYNKVSREDIAKRAGVAESLVSYYFKSMKKLRDAMVERAVETDNLKLIGQALADKHPIAKRATKAVREAAVLELLA